MTTYTIKDLILYNNPCRMCGHKVAVFLIPVGKNETGYSKTIEALYEGSELFFSLEFKYTERLCILINPMSNKFRLVGTAKNLKRAFKKFLKETNVLVEVKCISCHTYIHSNYLDFNLDYIRPTTIHSEFIKTKNETNEYQMITNFELGVSNIIVTKTKHKNATPFGLEIPAISLKEIGTKERLIKKIKLYMVLS